MIIKSNPNVRGLSQVNIRYSERFYTMYKKIFPQVVEELVLIPYGTNSTPIVILPFLYIIRSKKQYNHQLY